MNEEPAEESDAITERTELDDTESKVPLAGSWIKKAMTGFKERD